jgi:hypothetical protein
VPSNARARIHAREVELQAYFVAEPSSFIPGCRHHASSRLQSQDPSRHALSGNPCAFGDCTRFSTTMLTLARAWPNTGYELGIVMPPRIREHLARLFPESRVTSIEPLSPDSGATKDASTKAIGYGLPIRIRLVDEHGAERSAVWRVSAENEFGHDRRADRASNTLLAFDDFARLPGHIAAIDVGAITKTGDLVSLRDWDELYLITTFAPGTIYAEDLRRVAADEVATDLDLERVDALASYLAALHVPIEGGAQRYRRAIRDLVGHGEGIFGIVDGYPHRYERQLQAIERRCVDWRWRLRTYEDRLVRTHGDFHPFNIVFDGTQLACLDASRGTCGDAADDLAALAINYLFFAIDHPRSWSRGLGVLWHRLWKSYARLRPDPHLTRVVPPFFAWRVLVVCNPKFYPGLADSARTALFELAIDALDAGELSPLAADRLFG